MRQIFAHLHIPKCGGITIKDFLRRNFGSDLGDVNSLLNDYQYDEGQISTIFDTYPNLRCLTGHKLSLSLPFNRPDLDIHAFTWIRDPVERFVSHYYFHKNSRHTFIVPQVLTMDLLDYAKWFFENGNQQRYANGQLMFLGGSLSRIESLIKDNRLSLFPLQNLEESILILNHRFPDTFLDCKIVTKNTSKKDEFLYQELRDFIQPYVQQDLELLELARQTFTDYQKHLNYPAPVTLSGFDKLKIFRRRLALSLSSSLNSASHYISRHYTH